MQSLSNILSELKVTYFDIPAFQIVDALDIFFIAFLIYSLIVWIKETMAWPLFKGILVVIVFAIAAQLLELNAILWILSNALSVGITAIIIVFQPELRKALEQLGKGHFLSGIIPQSEQGEEKCSEKTIAEIIDAVGKMSSVKTGALILIEQDVPLGEIINTGIRVDSVVTSQILINIFEHNTPLHDGAVVIRNNRVAAATCFLPLTESKLSMDLGTRHRAAVGASEVSDAFVLIVSEETGHVSVAKGGKLYRGLQLSEITAMFKDKYKPTTPKIKRKKGHKKGSLE